MKAEEQITVRPFPDGTFPHVGQPFYGDVALGNGTRWRIGLSMHGRRLLVSIEGRGSYGFDSFVAAIYASEKLGIGRSDAENVSDFINDQLGADGRRQGSYDPGLTSPKGDVMRGAE